MEWLIAILIHLGVTFAVDTLNGQPGKTFIDNAQAIVNIVNPPRARWYGDGGDFSLRERPDEDKYPVPVRALYSVEPFTVTTDELLEA
jgi:hypothetical protein